MVKDGDFGRSRCSKWCWSICEAIEMMKDEKLRREGRKGDSWRTLRKVGIECVRSVCDQEGRIEGKEGRRAEGEGRRREDGENEEFGSVEGGFIGAGWPGWSLRFDRRLQGGDGPADTVYRIIAFLLHPNEATCTQLPGRCPSPSEPWPSSPFSSINSALAITSLRSSAYAPFLRE